MRFGLARICLHSTATEGGKDLMQEPFSRVMLALRACNVEQAINIALGMGTQDKASKHGALVQIAKYMAKNMDADSTRVFILTHVAPLTRTFEAKEMIVNGLVRLSDVLVLIGKREEAIQLLLEAKSHLHPIRDFRYDEVADGTSVLQLVGDRLLAIGERKTAIDFLSAEWAGPSPDAEMRLRLIKNYYPGLYKKFFEGQTS